MSESKVIVIRKRRGYIRPVAPSELITNEIAIISKSFVTPDDPIETIDFIQIDVEDFLYCYRDLDYRDIDSDNQWVVRGRDTETRREGILEWCDGADDAEERYSIMRRFDQFKDLKYETYVVKTKVSDFQSRIEEVRLPPPYQPDDTEHHNPKVGASYNYRRSGRAPKRRREADRMIRSTSVRIASVKAWRDSLENDPIDGVSKLVDHLVIASGLTQKVIAEDLGISINALGALIRKARHTPMHVPRNFYLAIHDVCEPEIRDFERNNQQFQDW